MLSCLSFRWLSLLTSRPTSNDLLRLVLLTNPSLNRRPFANPFNPLQQMWERLHVLLREARELPGFNPRPSPNVRDGVFALPISGQILARCAGVLATQLDFQHAIDAEGLVAEAFDGVFGSSLSAILPYVYVMGVWT
jgi:hypothetical protein